MSTDRDTTRIVRSWLQTDEYESADRVLDAVLDQLDTTPQRRATWWPVRRLPPMNTTAKLALGAAAAALVALIGYTVASGVNIGITDPSPPASPAASPAARALPGGGPLEAGTYRVSDATYSPADTEFIVPAGWTAGDAGALAKNADAPGEIGVEFWVVTHVYRDACDSAGTLEEIGPTPDDLVAALLNQENTPAVGPTELRIDGHAAQRVDLGYPTQLDDTTCRNPGIVIQLWADPAETGFFALHPRHYASVYVVDVNGERVVITAGHGPEATDEDLAEQQEIIESIRFPDAP